MAGDMVVGGVKNLVEIYTNKSVYHCNMAATDGLYTYHSSGENLEDVYVTEKLGTKTGWQKVFLEEEIMRGYVGELQDFVECAAYGRQPFPVLCWLPGQLNLYTRRTGLPGRAEGLHWICNTVRGGL